MVGVCSCCACFSWNSCRGFEYLQNTGIQLILFKKWLYIWNSNNCNQIRIGLLPWMGDNLLISFEIVVIGLAWVCSYFSSTLLPLAQDIPRSLEIDVIGARVFTFLENITLCSAYSHSAWPSCTREWLHISFRVDEFGPNFLCCPSLKYLARYLQSLHPKKNDQSAGSE